MDGRSIEFDEIGSAVTAILEDWRGEVSRALPEDVEAAAEAALAAVMEGSPKRTGAYAAGWRVDEESSGPSGTYFRVHNASKPGLAHLLEKGHALRQGGFAEGRPHIGPAAEAGMRELLRRIS